MGSKEHFDRNGVLNVKMTKILRKTPRAFCLADLKFSEWDSSNSIGGWKRPPSGVAGLTVTMYITSVVVAYPRGTRPLGGRGVNIPEMSFG